MGAHLHHAHLFARDIEASVAFYRDVLGGVVAFDGQFGGARNIFMRVGDGRLHFYDQPPRATGKNAVHHLGIRVADLAAVAARLRVRGHLTPSPVRDFGAWRYMMCEAPDGVLLELFEVDAGRLPVELAEYFGALAPSVHSSSAESEVS